MKKFTLIMICLIVAVSLFEEPLVGEGGSAIIKRVLHGTETFTGATHDVTIDSVDLSKSFLVFSFTVDDPGPSQFLVTGELDAANNIHFERFAAGPNGLGEV